MWSYWGFDSPHADYTNIYILGVLGIYTMEQKDKKERTRILLRAGTYAETGKTIYVTPEDLIYFGGETPF